MAWIYLLFAGLFEIGWPVGLKLSQAKDASTTAVAGGVALAVVCMGISGWLLWLAQKEIPMGTAYAVWTGIGAAGTFLVGVAFFSDAVSPLRFLSVGLIIAGVAGLKLAH